MNSVNMKEELSSDSASNQNIRRLLSSRRKASHVSRQMLVLLRWKVRPLIYYQAINSVTERDLPLGRASEISYKQAGCVSVQFPLRVFERLDAGTDSRHIHTESKICCCRLLLTFYF